jgi:hypothetical protein
LGYDGCNHTEDLEYHLKREIFGVAWVCVLETSTTLECRIIHSTRTCFVSYFVCEPNKSFRDMS